MLNEIKINLIIIKNDFLIECETRVIKKDNLYFFALEILTTLFAIVLLILSIFVNEIIYQM